MGFFSKTLSDFGEFAREKTHEATQRAKINSAIEAERRALAQEYGTLGELYYRYHVDDPELAFQPHVDAIRKALDNIDRLNDQIHAMEFNGRVCPHCGEVAPPNSKFCAVCGMSLAGDDRELPGQTKATEEYALESGAAQAPTAPTAPAPTQSAARLCHYCGSEVSTDAAVCPLCGSPL